MAGSRFVRLLESLAVATITVVLVLGVAELAFRALGRYRAAEFFLMPPHAVVPDRQSDWSLTYVTNSRGLRDAEHEAEPPAGTVRIVAVGDSFTFGQGVEKGAEFPAVLQEDLRRAGTPAEVVNVSNIGVGPEAYALLVREVALEMHPRVVVVNVYGNDASDDARPGLARRALRELSHHLRLATLLRIANQRLADRRSAAVAADPERMWGTLRQRCERHHEPADCARYVAEFRRRHGSRTNNLASVILTDPAEVRRWVFPDPAGPGWRAFAASLAEIASLCRARGARLVLGIVPDGAQVDRGQLELRRSLGLDLGEAALTGPGRFQSLTSELAGRLGADVYDPLPAFRAAGGGLYHASDLHFTPLGHRLYAQGLAEHLLRTGALAAP